MSQWVCCLLAFLLLILVTTNLLAEVPAPGQVERKRVAVLVGNSNYPGAALENPSNDAATVAMSLSDLDFDVSVYFDLERSDRPDLFRTLSQRFTGAEVALFYYAGHGLQMDGKNYVLPIDTDWSSASTIERDAIALGDLVALIAESGPGTKIIILDACRNDPSLAPGTDPSDAVLSTGFGFVEAPSGDVLIAFATGAGQVAFDSVGGSNGPYAHALANALLIPGAEMAEVFRQVRREVRLQTAGQQVPWITSSIENALYLRSPDPTVDAIRPVAGQMPPLDEILWLGVRSSGRREDYEALLDLFPDSKHAEKARHALTKGPLAYALGGSSTEFGRYPHDQSPEETGSSIPVTADRMGRSGRALLVWGYQYGQEISDWPTILPSGSRALGLSSGPCDDAAADPTDPAKLRPGLSDPQVNVGGAIVACAVALAKMPGEARLQYQLGRALDLARRHDLANAFFDLAVAQGYSAAMVARGVNERLGLGIAAPDAEAGFDLQLKAALSGNPRARNEVGRAYITGEGVAKNEVEGALWVKLGASQGWPGSLDYLGYLYSRGIGLAKDDVMAAALFRRAALAGSTTAMANLGLSLLEGQGGAVDAQEGLQWLERAMAAGNGLAFGRAARVYLNGTSTIPADPARADALFEEAIQRGQAQAFIDRGYARLNGQLPGGSDPTAALRDGLFAEAVGLKGAADLVAAAARVVPEEESAAIREEVARFFTQNGL